MKEKRIQFNNIVQNQLKVAQNKIDSTSFYINENKSNIMISPHLPPPIIAEIVNCTEKSEKTAKKVYQ